MDSTFDVIRQEMKNYVQNPEYKNLLKKMINYAKNTLGSDIIIHCRANDNSIIKEMNIPIEALQSILWVAFYLKIRKVHGNLI